MMFNISLVGFIWTSFVRTVEEVLGEGTGRGRSLSSRETSLNQDMTISVGIYTSFSLFQTFLITVRNTIQNSKGLNKTQAQTLDNRDVFKQSRYKNSCEV